MTTKAAHTPGPWRIDAFMPWIESTVTNSLIAIVEPDLHHKGEMMANLRLISAATEMLEALESFISVNDQHVDYEHECISIPFEVAQQIHYKALAVIRKAKGETA